MKILLGFLLAFGIGAICRFAGIPSPAPNAILGSLLVVSMSLGYVTAGQYLRRNKHTTSHHDGGLEPEREDAPRKWPVHPRICSAIDRSHQPHCGSMEIANVDCSSPRTG